MEFYAEYSVELPFNMRRVSVEFSFFCPCGFLEDFPTNSIEFPRNILRGILWSINVGYLFCRISEFPNGYTTQVT